MKKDLTVKDDIDGEPYGFIYITTNNINNKKYIGKRKYYKNHELYYGSGKLIKQAIMKYGIENFTREIIENCNSDVELSEREQYWINYYNAVHSNKFYNMAKGGSGGDTYSGLDNEERKSLKETLSKRSAGKKNPMYSKHHSEKTTRLISTLHKDRYSIKENNPNYGNTGIKNSCSRWIYCAENDTKYCGIREASRITGIPFPNIIKSLKSNGRLSAGKYLNKRMHWYYVEENEK